MKTITFILFLFIIGCAPKQRVSEVSYTQQQLAEYERFFKQKIDSINTVITEFWLNKEVNISQSSTITDYQPFLYVDEDGKVHIIPVKVREEESQSDKTISEASGEKTTETTNVVSDSELLESGQSSSDTSYSKKSEETPKDPFKLRYIFYILLALLIFFILWQINRRLPF